jgi:cobyrinic acid a,c-diamide synthase
VVIDPTPPESAHDLPRLVIAAPGSGHGKTTIATGLMGALTATGLKVAGFKVGPDYIDPGYHTLATRRLGRNLDPFLCGEEQMSPLLLHGAHTPESADIAIIEGVMGLFDGQIGSRGFASTAHVAGLLQAPVIMVIDISHTSRTAAAILHGLNTFDPAVRLSGVIINKSGSERHAKEIAESIQAIGLEVLGILPRDAGIEIPARHLGLVPAAEREEAAEAVLQLSQRVSDHVSLSSILSVARSAPRLEAEPWSPTNQVQPPSEDRPVVAIAAGRAFTFRYAETDELLRAAGCEPVVFDPSSDEQLPAGTAGLYLGGGFPEMYAAELAANEALRSEIGAAIDAGTPTLAECAGLLYLCRSVDGLAMIAALGADAIMTDRLTLRYRNLTADHDQLLAKTGATVTGHEFHRTTVEPHHGTAAAWSVDGEPAGFSTDPAGTGRKSVLASYLHVHWAGYPDLAQRFADAVHDHAWTMRHEPGRMRAEHPPVRAVRPPMPAEPFEARMRAVRQAMPAEPVEARMPAQLPIFVPDLHHHGDQDVAEGLVDLAVNVRLSAPPDWLSAIINDTTRYLASYPNPDAAAKAIAEAHGVTVDQVLPTAGGAEAFTLLARAIRPRKPLIIHPQFTEPEAALRAAGHQPQRLVLSPAGGFRLHADQVAEGVDLIMIGNPTNPTSVLHPAALINSLRRTGRIVVVDEAFMDVVAGEAESVISDDLTGLLVLRSLTKTWGLAGLRAGYVIGDPKLIEAIQRQQPPWSVSTPALAAMVACVMPDARRTAAAAAEEIASRRAYLVERLADIGLTVAGLPQAPFVLVDTSGLRGDREPGWVRLGLRDHSLAVRRGETFPGLGPDWIRIAVREPDTTDKLVTALRRLVRL